MSASWKRLAMHLTLVPLLSGSLALAQYDGRSHHNDFSQGAYEGGRGGGYDRGNDYGHGYDDHGRYNNHYQGHGYDNHGDYDNHYQGHGIGTGKGALIGGAGGAAVGAIFGGGLKGALIGGGAGAGIGAIAGHVHQENQKRDYYEDGGYRH